LWRGRSGSEKQEGPHPTLSRKRERALEEEVEMSAEMLARLIAQAEDEGAAMVTLRALAEEASEMGAERVLDRLGLSDPGARRDIGELRELLGAWRDAKTSARNAVIGWVVRILLAVLLMGLAVRFGLSDLVRG